jgi:hypothetical protein
MINLASADGETLAGVAPPDSVAAAAVMQRLRLPPPTLAVLSGETLLNEAVALLMFGVATAAVQVIAASSRAPTSSLLPGPIPARALRTRGPRASR